MADDMSHMLFLTIQDFGSRMIGVGVLLLYTVPAGGEGGAASEQAIRALKDVVVGEGDERECAICLLEDDDEAAAGWKEMPCEHRFHGGCLERWLRVRGTCPMCRRPLSPPAPALAQEFTMAEWMDQRDSYLLAMQGFQELLDEFRRTHP